MSDFKHLKLENRTMRKTHLINTHTHSGKKKREFCTCFPIAKKAEMLVQHKSRIFNQSVYLYQ